jgi:hypothetical protein
VCFCVLCVCERKRVSVERDDDDTTTSRHLRSQRRLDREDMLEALEATTI